MHVVETQDPMPKEVAKALLNHKRSLSEPQWQRLCRAFKVARSRGHSAEFALILAETLMKDKSS